MTLKKKKKGIKGWSAGAWLARCIRTRISKPPFLLCPPRPLCRPDLTSCKLRTEKCLPRLPMLSQSRQRTNLDIRSNKVTAGTSIYFYHQASVKTVLPLLGEKHLRNKMFYVDYTVGVVVVCVLV